MIFLCKVLLDFRNKTCILNLNMPKNQMKDSYPLGLRGHQGNCLFISTPDFVGASDPRTTLWGTFLRKPLCVDENNEWAPPGVIWFLPSAKIHHIIYLIFGTLNTRYFSISPSYLLWSHYTTNFFENRVSQCLGREPGPYLVKNKQANLL